MSGDRRLPSDDADALREHLQGISETVADIYIDAGRGDMLVVTRRLRDLRDHLLRLVSENAER